MSSYKGMTVAEYKHKWYVEHRALTIKRAAEWRVKNKEQYNALERKNAKKRGKRKRDPKKVNAYTAKWRAANLEFARKRSSEWYRQHPERACENVRRWAKAHPEQARANTVKWQKAHPVEVAQHRHNRKARVRGATGSHTAKEWLQLLEDTGFQCSYCRCSLTVKTATRYHVVPIFKGGSNDIGNIVPACKSCNSRKSAIPVEAFRQRLQA